MTSPLGRVKSILGVGLPSARQVKVTVSLTFTFRSVVSTEFKDNDNTEVGSARKAREEVAINVPNNALVVHNE